MNILYILSILLFYEVISISLDVALSIDKMYILIGEKTFLINLKQSKITEELISILPLKTKIIQENSQSISMPLSILRETSNLQSIQKKQDEMIQNLDSLIIENNIKYNKILKNWINPNMKIKSELLYRMSRDGIETDTFHNLCDNKGPTIILTK